MITYTLFPSTRPPDVSRENTINVFYPMHIWPNRVHLPLPLRSWFHVSVSDEFDLRPESLVTFPTKYIYGIVSVDIAVARVFDSSLEKTAVCLAM